MYFKAFLNHIPIWDITIRTHFYTCKQLFFTKNDISKFVQSINIFRTVAAEVLGLRLSKAEQEWNITVVQAQIPSTDPKHLQAQHSRLANNASPGGNQQNPGQGKTVLRKVGLFLFMPIRSKRSISSRDCQKMAFRQFFLYTMLQSVYIKLQVSSPNFSWTVGFQSVAQRSCKCRGCKCG